MAEAKPAILSNGLLPYLLIAIGSAILFLLLPPLSGTHLFDWDEINFAESAREMLLTGNYTQVQINFQPFWEKPPLFIWCQALSMHVFGVNEFAARLPNAICGIITLLTIFYLGKTHFNNKLAWAWVGFYLCSFLPHFYFKSGIIDPFFNLFIFLGIVSLINLINNKGSIRYAIIAGVFVGLAVLTKGPVGLLIPLLCIVVYTIVKRQLAWFSVSRLLLFLLVTGFVSSLWYGFEVYKHGFWYLEEFIKYNIRLATTQDSGHGQPFFYHPLVLLIGCFPASIFMLRAFKKMGDDTASQKTFHTWMLILFLVVLVLFSIIQTKIVHYSSLCYLPITFLAAYFVSKHNSESKLPNYYLPLISLLVFAWGLGFLLLPIIGNNPTLITPYINDAFAVANLQANINWPVILVIIGVFYLIVWAVSIYLLVKKNYTKAYIGIVVGQVITMVFVLYFFVPRIEAYTQETPINFFKNLAGKDVYINVLGYKSYAHYYYGNKQVEDVNNPKLIAYINSKKPDNVSVLWPDAKLFTKLEREWHLYGDIDKPVYFACKNTKAKNYRNIKGLVEINEANGFVFFKREPNGLH